MAKRSNGSKEKRGDNSNNAKKKSTKKKFQRATEIVFDAEARKAYLCGFSERKKQRRLYGLAMQKVKDRKARLEQRAQIRQAREEQVAEAEQQKLDVMEQIMKLNNQDGKLKGKNKKDDNEDGEDFGGEESQTEPGEKLPRTTIQPEAGEEVEVIQKYQDVQTKTMWGGEVIVTASTNFPDDEDEEAEKARKKELARKKKSVDVEQEKAGKVETYIKQLQAKMPKKKKKTMENKNFKGAKHGASNMKGMAQSTGDLRMVQKALAQAKQNSGKGGKRKQQQAGGAGGGKKRQKR